MTQERIALGKNCLFHSHSAGRLWNRGRSLQKPRTLIAFDLAPRSTCRPASRNDGRQRDQSPRAASSQERPCPLLAPLSWLQSSGPPLMWGPVEWQTDVGGEGVGQRCPSVTQMPELFCLSPLDEPCTRHKAHRTCSCVEHVVAGTPHSCPFGTRKGCVVHVQISHAAFRSTFQCCINYRHQLKPQAQNSDSFRPQLSSQIHLPSFMEQW